MDSNSIKLTLAIFFMQALAHKSPKKNLTFSVIFHVKSFRFLIIRKKASLHSHVGNLDDSQILVKKIKLIKALNEHEANVLSVIVGGLLGDSHLSKRKTTAYLRFRYSSKNLDYIHFLHVFFHTRGYCSNKPLKFKTQKKSQYKFLEFSTYSFTSFNFLHSSFYRKANETELLRGRVFIKKIPKNIGDYLNPQALAIWFMDDGSFNKQNKTIVLSTNSFTLNEVELLKKVLELNFNLIFIINKQLIGKYGESQYTMILPRIQVSFFLEIVKPFFVSSMFYKLNLDFQGNPKNIEQLPYATSSEIKTLFFNIGVDSAFCTEDMTKIKPQMLANWFIKNGCFHKHKNTILISTSNFQKKNIEQLTTILKKQFNLKFNIQKKRTSKQGTIHYQLYLPKKQVPNLIEIIIPYISPSNFYKLGLNVNGMPNR